MIFIFFIIKMSKDLTINNVVDYLLKNEEKKDEFLYSDIIVN